MPCAFIIVILSSIRVTDVEHIIWLGDRLTIPWRPTEYKILCTFLYTFRWIMSANRKLQCARYFIQFVLLLLPLANNNNKNHIIFYKKLHRFFSQLLCQNGLFTRVRVCNKFLCFTLLFTVNFAKFAQIMKLFTRNEFFFLLFCRKTRFDLRSVNKTSGQFKGMKRNEEIRAIYYGHLSWAICEEKRTVYHHTNYNE